MNRAASRRDYSSNGYVQPPIQIEELFASKGRVKILKILVEEGELNISEIGRRARLNYGTTVQHLEFLCKTGIVQEKNFGRIRIYRLKEEDIRVRALRSFFALWYNQ
ncbi:MAG: winged helix-turn-helix domain-containing protein [Candidatus Odinarchaeum yellowstonii]|uniref:Winged helix-turn-helix domain-containing protein n=1 Tax=Odinarchaeota yellowstonii (strain LCB_4) TaxID=1841599 RepID=A0AAF0D3H8_ODILC|nr:MAG: winged helix-turn-helix domain-containing protein [Candidatus Odinarchaeum yellowstonii]